MEELKQQLAQNQAQRIEILRKAVSASPARRAHLKAQSQQLQAEADKLMAAIKALEAA